MQPQFNVTLPKVWTRNVNAADELSAVKAALSEAFQDRYKERHKGETYEGDPFRDAIFRPPVLAKDSTQHTHEVTVVVFGLPQRLYVKKVTS